MALDAAAMVLATLASDSGGVAGAGQEDRAGALVEALPALEAWRLHPQLPGLLLALRNFSCTWEQRSALRAVAGSGKLGRRLLAALSLPCEGWGLPGGL